MLKILICPNDSFTLLNPKLLFTWPMSKVKVQNYLTVKVERDQETTFLKIIIKN